MRTRNAITIVLAIAMMIAAPLSAATIVWEGDIDTLWTEGTNWVDNIAPTTGDVAQFDEVTGVAFSVDMSGGAIDVDGIFITLGADLYDITNGTLNIGVGNVVHDATGSNTISGALGLGANSIVVTNGGTLEISGVLTTVGAAEIDVTGSTLKLTNAANSIDGLTTLHLGDAGALEIAGAATVFASLNAIAANESASITSDSNVTFGGASILNLDDNSSFTFTGGVNTTLRMPFTQINNGMTATITANSIYESGELMLLPATLNVGGSGAHNYDQITTGFVAGTSTFNFTGGATMTAGGYSDQTTPGVVLNLTGSGAGGKLQLGGTIEVAANATFGVGETTTFEVVDAAGPLPGSIVNLNGGTVKFSLGGIADPPDVLATMGISAHYDASQGVTLNGSSKVIGWNDLSGNDRHATKAATNATVEAGALNGYDVIDFGDNAHGTGSYLEVGGAEFDAEVVYTVFRNRENATFRNYGAAFGRRSGRNANWLFSANTTHFYTDASKPEAVNRDGDELTSASNFNLTANGDPINEFMVVRVDYSNSAPSTNTFYINRSDHSASDLEIAEILVFDSANVPGAAEEYQIGGYLAEKYGIDVSGTDWEGQSIGGPAVSGPLNMSTTKPGGKRRFDAPGAHRRSRQLRQSDDERRRADHRRRSQWRDLHPRWWNSNVGHWHGLRFGRPDRPGRHAGHRQRGIRDPRRSTADRYRRSHPQQRGRMDGYDRHRGRPDHERARAA